MEKQNQKSKSQKPQVGAKKSAKKQGAPKGGSIFILIIMLVSLVGFAMMSGGRSNSQGESTQLSDIPFQQMTDQTSGQVFGGQD